MYLALSDMTCIGRPITVKVGTTLFTSLEMNEKTICTLIDLKNVYMCKQLSRAQNSNFILC